MANSYLLNPVQILYNSTQSVVTDSALIIDDQLISFGKEARAEAKELDIKEFSSPNKLLAPCLVDPHSILEEPIKGRPENIKTLVDTASHSGYGQIALLPRGNKWRDSPEHLTDFKSVSGDIHIHLWGGFSENGKGEKLSSHRNLIQCGAIGLAEDDSIPPIELIKQGLILGEMGKSPLLLAPRDSKIQADGIAREGIEALRAGWLLDPISSETLPLSLILELQSEHPDKSIRLMNISTSNSISILSRCSLKPLASVSWWHLLSDSSLLPLDDIGWGIRPSLGNLNHRKSLIKGLDKGILNAVSVHSISLNETDALLPPDKRSPGLCGHQLVLPGLWQELIVKSGWSIEKLWKAISFGPSEFINQPEEALVSGSRRWLLFDPDFEWIQSRTNLDSSNGYNQPWEGQSIKGKVVACGLRAQDY